MRFFSTVLGLSLIGSGLNAGRNAFINFNECDNCGKIYCLETEKHQCEVSQTANEEHETDEEHETGEEPKADD